MELASSLIISANKLIAPAAARSNDGKALVSVDSHRDKIDHKPLASRPVTRPVTGSLKARIETRCRPSSPGSRRRRPVIGRTSTYQPELGFLKHAFGPKTIAMAFCPTCAVLPLAELKERIYARLGGAIEIPIGRA
jgi:hypothetical protein